MDPITPLQDLLANPRYSDLAPDKKVEAIRNWEYDTIDKRNASGEWDMETKAIFDIESTQARQAALGIEPMSPQAILESLAGNEEEDRKTTKLFEALEEVEAAEREKREINSLKFRTIGEDYLDRNLEVADDKIRAIGKRVGFTDLENARQANEVVQNKRDSAVVRGKLVIKPDLYFDREAFVDTVKNSSATPREKARVLSEFTRSRENLAKETMPEFQRLTSFRNFSKEFAAANPDTTNGDVIEAFKRSGNGDWEKTYNAMARGLLSGVEGVGYTGVLIGDILKKMGDQSGSFSTGIGETLGLAKAGSALQDLAIDGPAGLADTSEAKQDMSRDIETLGGLNTAQKLAEVGAQLGVQIFASMATGAVTALPGAIIQQGAKKAAKTAAGNVALRSLGKDAAAKIMAKSAAKKLNTDEFMSMINTHLTAFAIPAAGSAGPKFYESYERHRDKLAASGLAGEELEEAARSNALTDATRTGIVTGVVTRIFGLHGVEGIGRLTQIAANPTARKALSVSAKQFAKQVGKGSVGEGFEEALDEGINGALDALLENPDMTYAQWEEQVLFAGFAGAVFGAAVEVPTQLMESAAYVAKAQIANSPEMVARNAKAAELREQGLDGLADTLEEANAATESAVFGDALDEIETDVTSTITRIDEIDIELQAEATGLSQDKIQELHTERETLLASLDQGTDPSTYNPEVVANTAVANLVSNGMDPAEARTKVVSVVNQKYSETPVTADLLAAEAEGVPLPPVEGRSPNEEAQVTNEAPTSRNTDLFPDSTDFAGKLPSEANIKSYTENEGIGTAIYENPENGSEDVFISAFGDNDFVAYIRIYDEQGNPTNRFASKLERRSKRDGATRSMMEELQSRLPKNHEYTEDVSVSTDGLNFISSQLTKGYELLTDASGKPETTRIAINGESITNPLGEDVLREGDAFQDIRVTNQKQFERVRSYLSPLMEKFGAGLTSKNIVWENGRVYVDMPVLRKVNTDQASESSTDTPLTKTSKGNAVNQTNEVTTPVTPAPAPAPDVAQQQTPTPDDAGRGAAKVSPEPTAKPAAEVAMPTSKFSPLNNALTRNKHLIQSLASLGVEVKVVRDGAAAETFIGRKMKRRGGRGFTTRTAAGVPVIVLLEDRIVTNRANLDKLIQHEAIHAAHFAMRSADATMDDAAITELLSDTTLQRKMSRIYKGFEDLAPESQIAEVVVALNLGTLTTAQVPSSLLDYIAQFLAYMQGNLVNVSPEIKTLVDSVLGKLQGGEVTLQNTVDNTPTPRTNPTPDDAGRGAAEVPVEQVATAGERVTIQNTVDNSPAPVEDGGMTPTPTEEVLLSSLTKDDYVNVTGEQYQIVGTEDDGRVVVSNRTGGYLTLPTGTTGTPVSVPVNPYASVLSNPELDFEFLNRLGAVAPPAGLETIPGRDLPLGTVVFSVGTPNSGNLPPIYAVTPEGLIYSDRGRSMTHGGASPWRLEYVTPAFAEVVDKYNIPLPNNYVKEGNLYISQAEEVPVKETDSGLYPLTSDETLYHGSTQLGLPAFDRVTYLSRSQSLAGIYSENEQDTGNDGAIYEVSVSPNNQLNLWDFEDWVDLVDTLAARGVSEDTLTTIKSEVVKDAFPDEFANKGNRTWDSYQKESQVRRKNRTRNSFGVSPFWDIDGFDLSSTTKKYEEGSSFTNKAPLVQALFDAGYDTLGQLEGGYDPSEYAAFIVKDPARTSIKGSFKTPIPPTPPVTFDPDTTPLDASPVVRQPKQTRGALDDQYFSAIEAGDMDAVQRMVDEARFVPREVFYVKDIEVIRNPTDADYRQLSNDYRNEFPLDRSGDPPTRFTTDIDGNRWIWRSDMGTHYTVEPLIEAKEGKSLGQNRATTNWKLHKPITYDARGNIIPLSQRFNPNSDSILEAAPWENAGFYSKLTQMVTDKIPNRATPQQILATIDPTRGSGVKVEEIKWSGIEQAVDRIAADNNGMVPKQELLDYLNNEGAVKFEEVVSGDQVNDEVVSNWWNDQYAEKYPNLEWSLLNERQQDQARIDYAGITEQQENRTQYGQYQLPGGTNYKEVVLAMPSETPATDVENLAKSIAENDGVTWDTLSLESQNGLRRAAQNRIDTNRNNPHSAYTSSHFTKVPNYVAHMRTNERTDSDGRSGLFIEEIQSDRHQAGRKNGYQEDTLVLPTGYRVEPSSISGFIVFDPQGESLGSSPSIDEGIKKARMDAGITKGGSLVADAPFRKDWHLAMFKRALRDAVASGKDWIGWTTGDTQNDRFDLSKQVSKVYWNEADGTLTGEDLSETEVIRQQGVTRDNLADYVGKDVADRMVALEPDYTGDRTLRGEQLKVGGSGMKGFYDNMLPKEIGKYVKQWGGRVEQETIGTSGDASLNQEQEYNYDKIDSILRKGGEVYFVSNRTAGEELIRDAEDFANYLDEWGTPTYFIQGDVGPQIPIWKLSITPEMKRSVQSGQSLFAQTSTNFTPETEWTDVVTSLVNRAIQKYPNIPIRADNTSTSLARTQGLDMTINPVMMAESTAGMGPAEAAQIIDKIIIHEATHRAALTDLDPEFPNQYAAQMTVDEKLDTARGYLHRSAYATDEAYNTAVREFAGVEGNTDARTVNFKLGHEALRMLSERMRTGYTTEETIAFLKMNPNLLQRAIRYLKAYVNRLKSWAQTRKDPTLYAEMSTLNKAVWEMENGPHVERGAEPFVVPGSNVAPAPMPRTVFNSVLGREIAVAASPVVEAPMSKVVGLPLAESIQQLHLPTGGLLEVRGPSENVTTTMQANGKDAGAKVGSLPISSVNGLIRLNQPEERARVDALKEKMLSDKGFIASILVDADGDVIEGQHRLAALSELGAETVPVVVLYEAGDFIPDVSTLDKVLADSGLHRDQRSQMISSIGEILMDENGDFNELENYDAPSGFAPQWQAAMAEIERQLSINTPILEAASFGKPARVPIRHTPEAGKYKEGGWLTAAFRWDPRVFEMLQKSRNRFQSLIKEAEFFHKDLNDQLKKAFGKKEAWPSDTVNLALGNTDNRMTEANVEEIKRIKSRGLAAAQGDYLRARALAKQQDDAGMIADAALTRQDARATFDSAIAAYKDRARVYEDQARIDARVRAEADRDAAITSLPDDVQVTVRKMRLAIDALSAELVRSGALPDDLKATIDANQGLWLHRSYRIFDQENYAEWIQESKDPEAEQLRNKTLTFVRDDLIRKEADKQMAKNPGMTRAQAKINAATVVTNEDVTKAFNGFLHIADGGVKSLLAGATISKDVDALMKRGVIPKEIQELWGAYTDPTVNAAKSLGAVAQFVTQQQFLTNLVDLGTSEGWLSKDQYDANGERLFELAPNNGMSGRYNGSPSTQWAPLSGYYGPRALADAISATAQDRGGPAWVRTLMQLTGYSMASKTVLSWASTMKNFWGNVLIVIANGNLLSKNAFGIHKQAREAAWANFYNGGSDASRTYIKRLIELGVFGDAMTENLIRDLTNGLGSDRKSITLFDKIAEKTLISKATGGAGKFYKKAGNFYSIPDEFWKAVAFETELRRVQKYMPNATLQQQEEEAARIVKVTMPTYSQAPEIVQLIRKMPIIADFITFTSEVFRTSINTVKMTAGQIAEGRKTGNKALEKDGYQRLLGITLASAGLHGITVLARSLAGFDDKDEEDLRSHVPVWDQNATLMLLPTNRSDGKIDYMNISFFNPYDVWSKPLRAFFRGLNDPDSGVLETAKETLEELFDPITGERIFLGALVDIARGVTVSGKEIYDKTDSDVDKITQSVYHLYKHALEPGTLTSIDRVWKSSQGYVAPGSGRSYDKWNEIFSATMGLKFSSIDTSSTLQFSAKQFKANRSDSIYTFSKPFKSNGTQSDADIVDAYIKANAKLKRSQLELYKKMTSAVRLGTMTQREALRQMQADGVTDEVVRDILQNRFRRYEPSTRDLNEAKRKGDKLGQDRIAIYRSVRDEVPPVEKLSEDEL